MSQEFILSYEHIETMPQPGNALELLKRVTSLVKPIMRKHQWSLPTLTEFFPDEQNLLGGFNDQRKFSNLIHCYRSKYSVPSYYMGFCLSCL